MHTLVFKRIFLKIGFTSICLALATSVLGAVAFAAAPIVYKISPALSSVKPGATFGVTLSVTNSTTLAGGSVHIDYGNGSFVNFQSSGSASLSFVDYHPDQADLVYICNNNNCPPATYSIATINVKAGTSGTVKVTFTPKETANPQLGSIAADGASGSYGISTTAATSKTTNSTPGSNTHTIPQNTGTTSTIPQQVTDDQLTQENINAQKQIAKGTIYGKEDGWSTKKLVLVGVGIGIGLTLLVIVIYNLIRRRNGGFGSDYTTGGPPTTIFHG